MPHITRLVITLRLDAEDNIAEVVAELPAYCSSTFRAMSGGFWRGEFAVSCPIAPKLADGDFVDDFSPHFPALIRLKGLYHADYMLEIAVATPLRISSTFAHSASRCWRPWEHLLAFTTTSPREPDALKKRDLENLQSRRDDGW